MLETLFFCEDCQRHLTGEQYANHNSDHCIKKTDLVLVSVAEAKIQELDLRIIELGNRNEVLQGKILLLKRWLVDFKQPYKRLTVKKVLGKVLEIFG